MLNPRHISCLSYCFLFFICPFILLIRYILNAIYMKLDRRKRLLNITQRRQLTGKRPGLA
uniref:Uncharacterized protein MANES_07G107700 n=1 Tax=Rhizophora mucronata TaxID=61149 RepID=A0A2P2JVY3_RHIMU